MEIRETGNHWKLLAGARVLGSLTRCRRWGEGRFHCLEKNRVLLLNQQSCSWLLIIKENSYRDMTCDMTGHDIVTLSVMEGSWWQSGVSITGRMER